MARQWLGCLGWLTHGRRNAWAGALPVGGLGEIVLANQPQVAVSKLLLRKLL